MDRCIKIEAFMIVLESKLLIKIRPIMKNKMKKKSMFGRKNSGVQEVYQEVRREGYNA